MKFSLAPYLAILYESFVVFNMYETHMRFLIVLVPRTQTDLESQSFRVFRWPCTYHPRGICRLFDISCSVVPVCMNKRE